MSSVWPRKGSSTNTVVGTPTSRPEAHIVADEAVVLKPPDTAVAGPKVDRLAQFGVRHAARLLQGLRMRYLMSSGVYRSAWREWAGLASSSFCQTVPYALARAPCAAGMNHLPADHMVLKPVHPRRAISVNVRRAEGRHRTHSIAQINFDNVRPACPFARPDKFGSRHRRLGISTRNVHAEPNGRIAKRRRLTVRGLSRIHDVQIVLFSTCAGTALRLFGSNPAAAAKVAFDKNGVGVTRKIPHAPMVGEVTAQPLIPLRLVVNSCRTTRSLPNCSTSHVKQWLLFRQTKLLRRPFQPLFDANLVAEVIRVIIRVGQSGLGCRFAAEVRIFFPVFLHQGSIVQA